MKLNKEVDWLKQEVINIRQTMNGMLDQINMCKDTVTTIGKTMNILHEEFEGLQTQIDGSHRRVHDQIVAFKTKGMSKDIS